MKKIIKFPYDFAFQLARYGGPETMVFKRCAGFIFLHLISLLFLSAQAYELQQSKTYTDQEKELIIQLYDIGVVRFEATAINTQSISPYYIDLRRTISYPAILKKMVQLVTKKIESLSYDIICGVPHAALTIASNTAYELDMPIIMRRPYVKSYGTGKRIEGVYKAGASCLVFEDVVVTASSIIETIKDLEKEGLRVEDCVVLFDREQGGVRWMQEQGYTLHVLFTLTDFLNVLVEAGKISMNAAQEVLEWTAQNQAAGVNWKLP